MKRFKIAPGISRLSFLWGSLLLLFSACAPIPATPVIDSQETPTMAAQPSPAPTRTPSFAVDLDPSHQPTAKPTETAVPTVGASSTPSPTRSIQITPTAAEVSIFQLCSPLEDYPREKLAKIVSIPYRPPPPGWDDKHQGVDFVYHRQAGVERTIGGVPIQSILPGNVAAAIEDSFPFGNLVIIETARQDLPADWLEEFGLEPGESLYVLYAHMADGLMVKLGQDVASCQVLGAVGASGNTEAAHLHLETRIGPQGSSFPVMSAFVLGVTKEKRQNYDLWRTSMVFRHFDPMLLLLHKLPDDE